MEREHVQTGSNTADDGNGLLLHFETMAARSVEVKADSIGKELNVDCKKKWDAWEDGDDL